MKKEIKPVVYVITNKNNGKKYVGSAINYNVRRVRHLSELRCQRHHSSKLQNSFNKHGENAFEFNILETVDDINLLIEIEQKWIDKLKPEYNMTLIAGLNSNLGMKRSEETKKKMSQARIGMVFSKAHRENISKSKKGISINGTNMNKDKIGKPLKDEHREKIGLSNKGKKLSEETREKISKTLKSKKLQSAVSIKVKKYDMNGVLLNEYKSVKEAELDNGYKRDNLRYHLIVKNKKTYNGFIWEITKTNFYDK